MQNKYKIIFVTAILFRILTSFLFLHPDVRNHMDWGERFFEYGPSGFYDPEANVWDYTWPNQPPGTMLIFAGVYQTHQFLFSLLTWVNQNISFFPSTIMFFFEDNLYSALAHLPAVIADVGLAYLVFKVIIDVSKKKELGYVAAVIFLINPIVWYNSAVWGQYDSVINFFAFSAFYLLLKKRTLLALVALALSLYIKISLAIFVPVFILLLLKQKISLKQIIKSTLVTAAIFSLVTLLFSYTQDPWTWIYELYSEKVLGQQLHVITANAFNIWALLTGIHEQPDSLTWGPLSYQYWGYILFTPVYIFTLYKLWKSTDKLAWCKALTVIAFASFVLLTNMHERYLYPLFPYFTVLAVLNIRLMLLYWSVSLLSLINMYNYWFTPSVQPLISLLEYGNRFLPRVLGGIMTVLFGLTSLIIYKSRAKT